MIWESEEVRATLRMIESEHLDIRTVTMGISLRACATDDLGRTCDKVYERITRAAERLVPTAEEVQATFGVPITNIHTEPMTCPSTLTGFSARALACPRRSSHYWTGRAIAARW